MDTVDRPRILVVDDEENIRHLLRLSFEEEFEVLEAADGVEAFQVALRERPDLIVSDIMMPRLDGYGLYRKVKSRPETASAPFVFLSAKREVDERVVGLEMGADDYITKPFSIKELKAKVRSMTRKVGELQGRGSLEGVLREVDLADVIQLIEMGRKSGVLLLEGPQGAGEVHFERGEPLAARCGPWSGPAAFYSMMGWKEGRFRLEQGATPVQRNIPPTGGQELLMEGLRLMDEMAEAERLSPPPGTLLAPAPPGAEGCGEEMASLVGAFAGGASVADGASRAKLPLYRFYPLLVEALRAGRLRPRAEDAERREALLRLRAAVAAL